MTNIKEHQIKELIQYMDYRGVNQYSDYRLTSVRKKLQDLLPPPSQSTEATGLRSGDWYLNERGNKITILSVADGWCMVKEGDKKPFVVPEEFVLGTFNP
jgi:hypothetical protein